MPGVEEVTSTTPLSPDALVDKFRSEGRIVIRVKVIPKSSFNAIVGLLSDGTLKVRIAATPEHGKANEELISFLAEEFGTHKQSITILSGATDQLKLVKIEK